MFLGWLAHLSSFCLCSPYNQKWYIYINYPNTSNSCRLLILLNNYFSKISNSWCFFVLYMINTSSMLNWYIDVLFSFFFFAFGFVHRWFICKAKIFGFESLHLFSLYKQIIKELKMLCDECRSNSCIEHATGIMEEVKAPENLSKRV